MAVIYALFIAFGVLVLFALGHPALAVTGLVVAGAGEVVLFAARSRQHDQV